MYLYLVQHGLALPEEKDPQRPLSPEGKEAVKKIAQFLKSRNIQVDQIWHSRKLRAVQTAEIIAEAISCPKIIARDDLNPNSSVTKFSHELNTSNNNLMLIGHLPFLQKLSSMLLSGSDTNDFIAFKFAGVVAFEEQERWKISWFILPELL